MVQGRSIRLLLVDGTPNGLLSAEVVNWTGHVLTGPRSKLSELVQRPECGRTGIYFLVGPDPENSLRPLVYIGESDNVSTRLKQHNRPEVASGPGGGKDFWEKVCLVTSKDQNLTKAHVKYLESLLIQSAAEIGRCRLINGTAHEYINLPEPDRADMAFFTEQIRTVLPVLGLDFLRDTAAPSAAKKMPSAPVQPAATFTLKVPKRRIVARAQEVEDEFYVLEGSLSRGEWAGVDGGYQALFQQLCEDGVLREADEAGLRRFTRDYAFSSSSAAAAVVLGRSANGRKEWKVKGSGLTYGEWQDQQVSEAVKVTPE